MSTTPSSFKPETAYVSVSVDALLALPGILRDAGFHQAAGRVEKQIAARPSGEVRRRYIEAARETYAYDGITEFEDNAIVSRSEDGAYVMAWCWVRLDEGGVQG